MVFDDIHKFATPPLGHQRLVQQWFFLYSLSLVKDGFLTNEEKNQVLVCSVVHHRATGMETKKKLVPTPSLEFPNNPVCPKVRGGQGEWGGI